MGLRVRICSVSRVLTLVFSVRFSWLCRLETFGRCEPESTCRGGGALLAESEGASSPSSRRALLPEGTRERPFTAAAMDERLMDRPPPPLPPSATTFDMVAKEKGASKTGVGRRACGERGVPKAGAGRDANV